MKWKSYFRGLSIVSILLVTIFSSCKKEGIGDEQKESFLKFYGTSSYDQAYRIEKVSGGYVMVGTTTRIGSNGTSNTDISILKINEFGNEIWSYSYGDPNLNDEAFDFVVDDDGGFLITGYQEVEYLDTNNITTILENVLLLKLDAMGRQTWKQLYALKEEVDTSDYNRRGNAIVKVNDDIFISGIFGKFPISQENPSDIFFLKTESLSPGNFLANYREGTGNQVFSGEESVSKTLEGFNRVLIIATVNTNTNNEIRTETGFFSIELSTNGISTAALNGVKSNTNQRGISAVSSEGTLYVLSNVNGTPVDYIQLEEYIPQSSELLTINGIWSQDYTGENFEGDDLDSYATEFTQTSDGGFIITGYTIEGPDRQVLLIKTDANGNKLWSKSFGSDQVEEQGESVLETDDGGFLILCTSGDRDLVGNTSVMVIKTTSEGELK